MNTQDQSSVLVYNAIHEHQKAIEALYSQSSSIAYIGHKCVDALRDGKKILIFGNGGSAADAQHIAAEIVGRFNVERKGLPCIALTTDTSILTAVANDYGYNFIFSRQVEALATVGDIAIGISTSGNSINVTEALKIASKLGCFTVGLTGKSSGTISSYVDACLNVQSSNTAVIQECHILIGHILCSIIDSSEY